MNKTTKNRIVKTCVTPLINTINALTYPDTFAVCKTIFVDTLQKSLFEYADSVKTSFQGYHISGDPSVAIQILYASSIELTIYVSRNKDILKYNISLKYTTDESIYKDVINKILDNITLVKLEFIRESYLYNIRKMNRKANGDI